MIEIYDAISALLKSMKSKFDKIPSALVLMLSVLVEILAEFALMLEFNNAMLALLKSIRSTLNEM